jgi:hypothetical protein
MRYRIIIIILIVLSIVVTGGTLNYTGFCFAKSRWLSSEEKMQAAFDAINKGNMAIANAAAKENDESFYIPYVDFDEFIKTNPNCCEINPSPTDLRAPVGFWRSVFGNDYDVVVVRYVARYMNEQGVKWTRYIVEPTAVKSCGYVRIGNWH